MSTKARRGPPPKPLEEFFFFLTAWWAFTWPSWGINDEEYEFYVRQRRAAHRAYTLASSEWKMASRQRSHQPD